jgi:general secretion pathway protein H
MTRDRGFTLLELMVVVAIVALASAGATLALRDSSATQLEREGLRLAALLEAARAQSRTSGVPVVWRVLPQGFELVGVQTQGAGGLGGPRRWLDAGTQAEVTQPAGSTRLVLGPEPLIAAQRVRLMQGERQLVLGTDGLAPFAVVTP